MEKWINSIEKHQRFDYCCQSFYICCQHFTKQDFIQEGEKKYIKLIKPDAVPSVFVASNNGSPCAKRACLDGQTVKKSCEECIKFKISLLAAEDKVEELSTKCSQQANDLKKLRKQLKGLNAKERKTENLTWLHRLAVPVIIFEFYSFGSGIFHWKNSV